MFVALSSLRKLSMYFCLKPNNKRSLSATETYSRTTFFSGVNLQNGFLDASPRIPRAERQRPLISSNPNQFFTLKKANTIVITFQSTAMQDKPIKNLNFWK